jgi:hypothetical protein
MDDGQAGGQRERVDQHPLATALGRRVTTGASATTRPHRRPRGKPKIKPVRPNASGACVAPNNRSNRSTIF